MSKVALKLSFICDKILIPQTLYTLVQLKKNQPISLLEIAPGRSIQYARAVGSNAIAIKMDSRTGTGLVKLPSGVKKIFSIYSLASPGQVALSLKKKIKITSAGFFKKMGKKSITRGVAKNPVDHPHGGRNKAIRYQRTP
jgi:large subunit ribosomal protein L2